jgi:hypothetical protein
MYHLRNVERSMHTGKILDHGLEDMIASVTLDVKANMATRILSRVFVLLMLSPGRRVWSFSRCPWPCSLVSRALFHMQPDEAAVTPREGHPALRALCPRHRRHVVKPILPRPSLLNSHRISALVLRSLPISLCGLLMRKVGGRTSLAKWISSAVRWRPCR